jgi:serine/threonine protein phosphatase PrpC
MIVKSSSHNGIGKVNEDYLICRKLSNNCVVAILADGMGGLSHGDLAARIVADTVAQFIEEQIATIPPKDLLRSAINQANEAIKSESYALRRKMGAAIAVLLIIEEKAYFSWLGNVRIYLIKNNDIKQLTTDHVINSENKNLFLTRCVNGKEFREEPPCGTVNLTPEAHLLLCSDGFYQNLTMEDICYYGADAVRLITDAVDDFSVIKVSLE